MRNEEAKKMEISSMDNLKLLKEKFPESIEVSIKYMAIYRQESKIKCGWRASASLKGADIINTPTKSCLKKTPTAAIKDLLYKRGL